LGSVAPSDSRLITATVSLAGDFIGLVAFDSPTSTTGLTFTTSIGSSATDLDVSNNMWQIVKPIELAGPDVATWLNVAGVGPAGTIKTGQDLTYTVGYGNWGNQIAHTTTLTLSLESGLSVIGAQPAPARTAVPNVFSGTVLGWDWGNLSMNDSGAVQVRVHVDSVSADGSLVIAAIQSADLDIRPLNNVDRDSRLPVMTHVYLPLVLRN
jgi:hypothetical protein